MSGGIKTLCVHLRALSHSETRVTNLFSRVHKKCMLATITVITAITVYPEQK